MLKLNLKKPLIVFDLETTGAHIPIDRIVELSMLKIDVNQEKTIKTLRVNPEMPIPLEVSLIHGIYDEDVKDKPVFKSIAPDLLQFIGNADFAGFNSNKFDIPILCEEFLRAGYDLNIDNRKSVDVMNIFHQMEQRTLKAAYKFYCNKDLINAHSAQADTEATYEVLLAQIQKYDGVAYEDKKGNVSHPIKNDIDALHEFTFLKRNVDFAGTMIYDKDGDAVFNIGKHKGLKVKAVFAKDPSYYDWMMKSQFAESTKKKITEIRLQAFNQK